MECVSKENYDRYHCCLTSILSEEQPPANNGGVGSNLVPSTFD